MSGQSIQESFIIHVLQGYGLNQGGVAVSAELREFVQFLITEDLISPKQIREYLLMREFDVLYRQGKYKNKSETVRKLAQSYGVSEAKIWSLLKHRKKYSTQVEA